MVLFMQCYSSSHTVLFARYYSSHPRYCSHGTVHLVVGSLPRAVTMLDDIEAAALRARLEAMVKEVEDAEA
jgi:hypothetical protein